ncbi:MAG: type II secretion system protein [Rhodocyclales bacterium]|nr:type II secretion system protein [Rhodocyclales bacterium]
MTVAVPPRLTFARGFTLTELAMVLFIIALLLGSLMLPIAAQIDTRDNVDAVKTMGEIREALIGYAASRAGKPYLPCPDTDGDGIEEPRNGFGNCPAAEGDVPWNTLGLGRTDPWNRSYRYSVSLAFSNSGGFLLTSAGTFRLCVDSANCGTTVVASAVPAVILTKGKNGAGANANEVENSDADNDFVSKEPDPAYDDLVIWLSPNILFNRMVAAGRLP